MKKIAFYFVLFLLVFSCENIQKQSCITNAYPILMKELKTSYTRFLATNGYSTTNQFLETYAVGGTGPQQKLIFDKKEEELFQKLDQADFLEFAFERIDFDTYWDHLPQNQREKMIKKAKQNAPNAYSFNPNSEFAKCMEEMSEQDSVAYYYFSIIIKEVGSASPAVLSPNLLNYSSRYPENNETVDWITIVEFYYPLLKNEFE